MLRLRPYLKKDGEAMISWLQEEKTFRLWCADQLSFPLSVETWHTFIDKLAIEENAFVCTYTEEDGTPVGTITMRKFDHATNKVHFGFIILDHAKRSQGYGKEMMILAIRYATQVLGYEKITLAVFEENERAHRCYLSVGFEDTEYLADFKMGEEIWPGYFMGYQIDRKKHEKPER